MNDGGQELPLHISELAAAAPAAASAVTLVISDRLDVLSSSARNTYWLFAIVDHQNALVKGHGALSTKEMLFLNGHCRRRKHETLLVNGRCRPQ